MKKNSTGSTANARLLPASRNQLLGGIGNETGVVGRCYMGHRPDLAYATAWGRIEIGRPDLAAPHPRFVFRRP